MQHLVGDIVTHQGKVRLHADRQIKPHASLAGFSEPSIFLNFNLAIVVFRWNVYRVTYDSG